VAAAGSPESGNGGGHKAELGRKRDPRENCSNSRHRRSESVEERSTAVVAQDSGDGGGGIGGGGETRAVRGWDRRRLEPKKVAQAMVRSAGGAAT
jgi:hypothetical protein